MAGGTAYYFSCAVSQLDTNFLLVTSIADNELHYADELRRKNISVEVQKSAETVFFENIYGDDPDERQQNVLAQADPFTMAYLDETDAQVFHLGPLMADDISLSIIQQLAVKGQVSLDVQGYLRKLIGQKVYPAEWNEKLEALKYISILKADVAELKALTGNADVRDGAKTLASWGVKEAVITNGSKGSLIYYESEFFDIPAYRPEKQLDATGCGDTYMAGYLYKRMKGANVKESGEFAAAMAGLKIENYGPFNGNEADVLKKINAG